MPKISSTERVRAFRQRQRGYNLPKKIPKSGAQRAREFRARQKALKAAAAASNLPAIEHFQSVAMPSTSNSIHQHSLYDPSQSYTNFRVNRNIHEEFNDKLWVLVKESTDNNTEEEYIIGSGDFSKEVHHDFNNTYARRNSIQHGENCCKQCFSELKEINLKILQQQHEILQLLKNSREYHANTQLQVPLLTPDMIKEELTD